MGRSLYEARDCTPESFYLGNPVSWPDLAQNLDIRRDLQAGDTRLSPTEFDEQYLPALVERVLRCDCPLVLFRGPGGCGKTTQLLRTAFEIDRRFSDQAIVLHLRHSHELASAEVAMACAANQDKAIILAVDEAGPLALEIERRRNSYRTARRKVGFLCAERPNMWPDAAVGDVLEVSSALSRTEAKELLQRLGAHGMLGALEDLSEEEQIEALAERYDRQILVTLREATSGQRFDEIIRSEYARMPGDAARDIYLEAAVLHRCRLPLPEALAIALAGCEDRKGFRRKVWRGARGALVKDGPAGDKFYRTRHARIAEVLCESLPAARIAEEVEQIIAQYVVTHDVEARVPIFRLLTHPNTESCHEFLEVGTILDHLSRTSERPQAVIHDLVSREGWPPIVLRLVRFALEEGFGQGQGLSLWVLTDLLRHDTDPSKLMASAVRALERSTVFDERTEALQLWCWRQRLHRGDRTRGIELLREAIKEAWFQRWPAVDLRLQLSTQLISRGAVEEAAWVLEEGLVYCAGNEPSLTGLVRTQVDLHRTTSARDRSRVVLDRAIELLGEPGLSTKPDLETTVFELRTSMGETLVARERAEAVLAIELDASSPVQASLIALLLLSYLEDHETGAVSRVQELARTASERGLLAGQQLRLLHACWVAEIRAEEPEQTAASMIAWGRDLRLGSDKLVEVAPSFLRELVSMRSGLFSARVARTLIGHLSFEQAFSLLPLSVAQVEDEEDEADVETWLSLVDAELEGFRTERPDLVLGMEIATLRLFERQGRLEANQSLLSEAAALVAKLQIASVQSVLQLVQFTQLLLRMGKIDEARALLTPVISDPETSFGTADHLAGVLPSTLRFFGNPAAALTAGEWAIETLEPRGSCAFRTRTATAAAAAQLGQFTLALDLLEGEIAARQGLILSYVGRIATACHLSLGNVQSAREILDNSITTVWDSESLVVRALVKRQQGDDSSAREIADTAVERTLCNPAGGGEPGAPFVGLIRQLRAPQPEMAEAVVRLGVVAWQRSAAPDVDARVAGVRAALESSKPVVGSLDSELGEVVWDDGEVDELS